MEYVVGDEHTFDFWVQWTAPNGKFRVESKVDLSLRAFLAGHGLAGVVFSVIDMKHFVDSIGIQEVGRSLPFQPWDKPIERFFGTVCQKFSKWFESYTGTLTGSKTYAKRKTRLLASRRALTIILFFHSRVPLAAR